MEVTLLKMTLLIMILLITEFTYDSTCNSKKASI
jgi:hypothetical protein